MNTQDNKNRAATLNTPNLNRLRTPHELRNILKVQFLPLDIKKLEEYIRQHRKLVGYCMKKISGITSYNRDDIEQVGLIALWKAAKNFDPSKGAQFSTYAVTIISREMYHAVHGSHDKLLPLSWDELEETCPSFESMLSASEKDALTLYESNSVIESILAKAETLNMAKERKGVKAYALYIQGYSYGQIAKAVGFGVGSSTAMISFGRKVVRANPLFKRILIEDPHSDTVTVELNGTPFMLRYANELTYESPVRYDPDFIRSFAKVFSIQDVADYILNKVRIGENLCIFDSEMGYSVVMTVGKDVLDIFFVSYAKQSTRKMARKAA